MTTQIVTVKNDSAGHIVLADNISGTCVGIPTNTESGLLLWSVSTDVYQQAILGPGATNVGPGTYDWIYDDQDRNINALRAGPNKPTQLVHVNGGGILYIYITYSSSGTLSTQQGGAPEGASS